MNKILLISFLLLVIGKFGLAQTKADQPSNEIFSVVEQMPEYPGGQEKLVKYLQENIIYPEKALKAGKQGTVYIKFIVEKDGTITNVQIMKGFDAECDEVAKKIVLMMPKWNPGKQRGENVRVAFILPVRFQLS